MAMSSKGTGRQRPRRPHGHMRHLVCSFILCFSMSFVSASSVASTTQFLNGSTQRIRRRRLGVKAGPGHSNSNPQQVNSSPESFSVDDDFEEFHNNASESSSSSSDSNRPSVFSLARYVDPDSILYDTIEGFFFAAIFTVVVVVLYRCCCSCCERCGMCPETGRRRRKKRGIDGHEYAAISTDLYRDHHDKGGGLGGIGGYRNEYGDCDGSSSGDESETSMEYGELDDDEFGTERFDDRHIGDAAKRYFDREERIGRQKERKQRAAAARSGSQRGMGNSKSNGSSGAGRANGGGAGGKIKRGIHRAMSGGTGIIDGEEPAPLDLEMIERKIVESMEDGPEFARPPTK